MQAQDPLRPTIRQPYGPPGLPGGLPTSPIPVPAQRPSAFQQHLTRLDAQGRHATYTTNLFGQFDPDNAANAPTIHQAAETSYRHPDASMHSLNTAFQADRAAQKAQYRATNPLARPFQSSPTEQAVKRAEFMTQATPNAAMMGTVIRSDPQVESSFVRRNMMPNLRTRASRLTDTDPNYRVREYNLEPRPLTQAETEHQFGSTFSTEHPTAIRERQEVMGVQPLQERNALGVYVQAAPHAPAPEPQLPAYSGAAPAYPGQQPPPYSG